MKMVKPLIQRQLIPKTLSYKPCAIMMGRISTGKTTLVNLLCGTQHEVGEGEGSFTRNLFLNDTSCGNNAFSLIDTPGTNSSSETYKHAILLRADLTATKINTIFIIIEYHCRFDNMIDNYYEVEQLVYNYVNKVVVLISHWDQSKNSQNNYEEICKKFQNEYPTLNNLIFYSERSSKAELANLIYGCVSNMEKDKLEIKDEQFFLKFNVYQMKTKLKVSYNEYQRKAILLSKEYTELILSVQCQSVEDKDEVIHMTIVYFKDEMEALLNEFRAKHGLDMVELDYYVFVVKLEKENVKICYDFVERAVPLMSYNLFDNKDPRNLIKRCPYCQLIWFKTEGYDGTTTCGNSDFKSNSINKKVFWKYKMRRKGGKLQWEKTPIEKETPEQKLEETLKDQNAASSKRVGCGKQF
ncbi:unnamed protein product [Rotaria magnacalcarata]|uniref:G domain-containing protein n=3 Tax=Rotaria magnacalcarata TaxID=392030 RepID=A0A816Z4B3_9BILA|nr:unnamed protein product [Rotaria magnacalcarata]